MGAFLVTSGLGNYVANLLVVIVKEASNGDWYPVDNPNKGHFEYFFFLLAGLMMLNFLVFLYVASSYKYKTSSLRNFGREPDIVQQDNPQVWSQWVLYQSRPSTVEIILFFFFVLAFVLCLVLFSGSQSTPFFDMNPLSTEVQVQSYWEVGEEGFLKEIKKQFCFIALIFDLLITFFMSWEINQKMSIPINHYCYNFPVLSDFTRLY